MISTSQIPNVSSVLKVGILWTHELVTVASVRHLDVVDAWLLVVAVWDCGHTLVLRELWGLILWHLVLGNLWSCSVLLDLLSWVRWNLVLQLWSFVRWVLRSLKSWDLWEVWRLILWQRWSLVLLDLRWLILGNLWLVLWHLWYWSLILWSFELWHLHLGGFWSLKHWLLWLWHIEGWNLWSSVCWRWLLILRDLISHWLILWNLIFWYLWLLNINLWH